MLTGTPRTRAILPASHAVMGTPETREPGEHTLLTYLESEPLYSISHCMRLFGVPRSAVNTRKGCRGRASQSLAARNKVPTASSLHHQHQHFASHCTSPKTASRHDKFKDHVRLSTQGPNTNAAASPFQDTNRGPFLAPTPVDLTSDICGADADENDRRPTPARTTTDPAPQSKRQCACWK